MFQDNPNDPDIGPGCRSFIGRQGGIQKIQLSEDRCYTKDSITHEMIHAIGHFHEHTRPDRNDHIKINISCILYRARENFKIQKLAETYALPYDYYSIMHYDPSQASTFCKTMTSLNPSVPDDKLGSSTEMTDLDVKKISRMQKCTIQCKLQ